MRCRDSVESELRLVAAIRRVVRAEGGPLPSTAWLDELLDERCGSTVTVGGLGNTELRQVGDAGIDSGGEVTPVKMLNRFFWLAWFIFCRCYVADGVVELLGDEPGAEYPEALLVARSRPLRRR